MAIRFAAVWNPKAKRWVAGRKDIFSTIAASLRPGPVKPVWMHCASLGEFEQGRPLLEALKNQHPHLPIVLSFFSPSGYEVMKDYKGADHIFYLPMDSPANARKFIDAVDPQLVLWVKYEYWFYYLSTLKERRIPVLLVSGIFRDTQPFFKWYGDIWRKMLGCFSAFFVQNTVSKELLNKAGINENVFISGDTRFDRVINIMQHFTEVPKIDAFCAGPPVLVAGSTWDEDVIELLHFVNNHPDIRFIIAPHEIDTEILTDLKKQFPGSVFYSEWNPGDAAGNILIINNIGMLSRLYKYATVAFVGGGFGDDGVHNVLEPAVYSKPVVFGPVYHKFDEAIGLHDAGGAVSAGGPLELDVMLEGLFSDAELQKRMGTAAGKFVAERAGATEKILGYIQEKRLLTS